MAKKKVYLPILGTEKFHKMTKTEKKIYVQYMENPVEHPSNRELAKAAKVGSRAVDLFMVKYRSDLTAEVKEIVLAKINGPKLLTAIDMMLKKAGSPSGAQDRALLFKMAGLLQDLKDGASMPSTVNVGVFQKDGGIPNEVIEVTTNN